MTSAVATRIVKYFYFAQFCKGVASLISGRWHHRYDDDDDDDVVLVV